MNALRYIKRENKNYTFMIFILHKHINTAVIENYIQKNSEIFERSLKFMVMKILLYHHIL
jgi:hypothetical protein